MGLLRGGRRSKLEAHAEPARDSSQQQRARANWRRALRAVRRHLAAATDAPVAGPSAAPTGARHVRIAALVHRAEGLTSGQLADRCFVKAHIVQHGERAKARQSTTMQRLASGLAAGAAAPSAPSTPSASSARRQEQQQQQQEPPSSGLTCSWQEMLTVETFLTLAAKEEQDRVQANKPPSSSSSRALLAASARRQGLELALRVKAARALTPDAVIGEARVPLADVIEHPEAWAAPRWLPLRLLPETAAAAAAAGAAPRRPAAEAAAGRLRFQLFLSRSALPSSLRVLCATWNVGNAVPPPPEVLREHWFRLPPLLDDEADDEGGGGADGREQQRQQKDELPHLVFVGAQECNFARESAKLLKKARSERPQRQGRQRHGGEDDDQEEPESLREGGVIGGAAGGAPSAGGAPRRSRSWRSRARWERRGRPAGGSPTSTVPSSSAAMLSPSASIVAAADAVAALYNSDRDGGGASSESSESSSSDDDPDDGAPGRWRARGAAASPSRGRESGRRLQAAEEGDATRAAPLAPAPPPLASPAAAAALKPVLSMRLRLPGTSSSSFNSAATRGASPVAGRSPTAKATPGLGGEWDTDDGRAPALLSEADGSGAAWAEEGRGAVGGGMSIPSSSLRPAAAAAPPACPPAAAGPSASVPGGGGGGGFAAGLRAQVDSAREWEAACSAALGSSYFLIGARHMFQTRALLFARADVVPDVARVRTDSEATGIGRVAPNKGGVAVAARIGATDLVFINAHLAAHQSRAAAREADVAEIIGSLLQRPDGGGGGGGGEGRTVGAAAAASSSSSSAAPRWGGGHRAGKKWWQVGATRRRGVAPPLAAAAGDDAAAEAAAAAAHAAAAHLHRLPLGVPGADVCTGFAHAFWVGDLNFRIDYGTLAQEPKDTPDEEDWTAIAAAAARRDFQPLREADQLLRARREGRVFAGWSEAELNFPPTFKVSKGRAGERYARKRAPAWTDRVLWRSALPQAPARPLGYWSAPVLPTSDHKPVAALLDVPVRSRTVAAAAGGYGAAGAAAAAAAGAAAAAAAASASGSSFSARALRARSAALLSRPVKTGAGGGGVAGLRAPSAFGGLLGGRLHLPQQQQQQQQDPEAVAVPYRLVVSSMALPADVPTWAALLREAATADGAAAAASAPAAVAAPASASGRAATPDPASDSDDFWQLSVRLELRGACLSRDQAVGGGSRAGGGGGGVAGLLRRAFGGGGLGDRGGGAPPRAKLGQAVARTAGAATLVRPAVACSGGGGGDGRDDVVVMELLPGAGGGGGASSGGGGGGPSALSAALLPARLGDLEDESLVLCVIARRVAPAEGTIVEAEGGERVVARGIVPLAAVVAATRARRGATTAVPVELERCGRHVVTSARLQMRLVEALKVETLAASAAHRMAALIGGGSHR